MRYTQVTFKWNGERETGRGNIVERKDGKEEDDKSRGKWELQKP